MNESKCFLKKPRNIHLDFIKGIAIMLVVVGHNIQFGSGASFYKNGEYFYNPIFKFIYSFHMPLFMLVSGYLFYWSCNKYSLIELVKNRIIRLIIPIFAWSIVTQILTVIKAMVFVNGINVAELLFLFLKTGITHLWFLWAVFYCSLAVILVYKLVKDNVLIYILIGIVLMFLPDVFNGHLYKYMYPYFVGAYLWNKYGVNNFIASWNWKLKILSVVSLLIVFIILFHFFNYDSYVYNTYITLLGRNMVRQFVIDIYRWLIGFVGSGCVIIFCIAIVSICKDGIISKISNGIAYLGKLSLGLYIINSYINSYVLLHITSNCSLNGFILFGETTVVIAFSLLIIFLINKVKVLRVLLFGGR